MGKRQKKRISISPWPQRSQLQYFRDISFKLPPKLSSCLSTEFSSFRFGYPRSRRRCQHPLLLIISVATAGQQLKLLHMTASWVKPINFIITRKINSLRSIIKTNINDSTLTLRRIRESFRQYDLVFIACFEHINRFSSIKGNARMFEAWWPFIYDAFTNMECLRWSSFSEINS